MKSPSELGAIALPEVVSQLMAQAHLVGRPVVGYSGGVDSQVLLHVLAAGGYQPIALHVNHQLQAAAVDFDSHCESYCAKHSIEFYSFRVDVASEKLGLEANAREARYQAMCSWMQANGHNSLWLAHHEDDQIEGVLIQLFRGSGPRGLAGMQPVGPVGVDRYAFSDISLIRPLLGFTKRELIDYARAAGLSWVEDPTNTDDALRRNWIRNKLLPEVEEQFPQARSGLRKLSVFMRDYFSELEGQLVPKLVGLQAADGRLRLSKWQQEDTELRAELLKLWLEQQGVRCNKAQLLEMCRQLMLDKGGFRQVVSGWKIRVSKHMAQLNFD